MNLKGLYLAIAAVLLCQTITSTANRSREATAPSNASITARASADEALHWADSVMSRMSDNERIAQLFVPRLDITDNAAGIAAIRKMTGTHGVGGFLLGKGTIKSYANLINAANEAARIAPLVTLDGEWGLAMRLTDAPRFPYNMGLGAISDTDLLEEYGYEVARECRELGINVNFAPDVDVNSNPSNPVIGYRSFGEDPGRVAKAGVAYGKGLEQGGVLSVAKHFPGHGDTSTDSHKTLPTVDHTLEQMEEIDLLPFRSYVDAGLGGIMVGHLRVPSLDKSGTPASLSNRITTKMLIDRMGFNGLVFTDALAMKGAVAQGNNCVAAFKAGADVLLGSGAPVNDIAAMKKALESGEISRERVNASCRKILAYKYVLGLTKKTKIDLNGLKARINSEQARDVARRLAEASLTLVHDNDKLIPLGRLGSRSIAVVSIGLGSDNEFARMCANYCMPEMISIGKDGTLTNAQIENLRKMDVVIVGVGSDSQAARNAFSRLTPMNNVIGVFFMNPYKMARFGGALHDIAALVAAYDNTPELRRAAAEGIFGGIAMTGRFPVNLRGIAGTGDGRSTDKVRLGYATPSSRGFKPELTERIDSVMDEALKAGAFPGAQVLVARKGDIVVSRNYGFTDNTRRTPVTDSTLYDLASVTKATGTLAGLMKAYNEGLFDLDDKISATITELKATDKSNITWRQLLFHESGLQPGITVSRIATEPVEGSGKKRTLRSDWIRRQRSDDFDSEMARGLYVGLATRDSLMNRIYNSKLRSSKSYRYSDLNFCLLMEGEERLTGVDHDQWVATEIFEPLGASTLIYNPAGQVALSRIAPTENDTEFRRQTIHGYVHDETAAVSGGVQGNAGLFGTALDLAKLCQMYLNRGSYGGEDLLWPKTVDTFTKARNHRGNRALGFDLQPDDSPAPASVYGHNGFTGTCFWVDPENEIIIVFLSNRVHPSRNNRAFSTLKPRTGVIEAVYRSL